MSENEKDTKLKSLDNSNNATNPSEVLKKVQRSSKRVVKRGRSSKNENREKDEDAYDKRIINIRRVSRVYKGGKRMRLSVFLAVGDKRGNVGLGLGKGADVKAAEQKAYNAAVKNLTHVATKGRTIPHFVEAKYKSSKIVLKPAAPGTGIIAGESVRALIELAGVKDILTKRYGSTNSVTIAYSTLKALKELRLARI